MNARSTFELLNQTGKTMVICHEPEGFEFELPPNESVIIDFESTENSLMIKYSIIDGTCYAAIWPDKSNFRVFHKNADVFEEFL